MKVEEIEILIKHRLEQAREALDDAKYLIDGNRSPQSPELSFGFTSLNLRPLNLGLQGIISTPTCPLRKISPGSINNSP